MKIIIIICLTILSIYGVAFAESQMLKDYKIAVKSNDLFQANKIQNAMNEPDKKESIKFYKQYKKQTAESLEKSLVKNRQAFAKRYESDMLNKGLDIYASAIGKNSTTLKLKYVLINRPLVYKLINDAEFISGLKGLGFKKLIMSDGYNSTWSSDI